MNKFRSRIYKNNKKLIKIKFNKNVMQLNKKMNYLQITNFNNKN